MDKRVTLVSPDGGTEIEVFESDAKFKLKQCWKNKSDVKPAKPAKEGK